MIKKPPMKKGSVQRGLKPKIETAEVETDGESILDQVEEELESEGIKLFDNEDIMDDYLRLPADLTEEPSKELGKYFTTLTKQKVWTRTLLGRASAVLREVTEELDDIKDKVFSELPAKMSVTEKNLKLRSHEIYGEKATELLKSVAVLEEKTNILKDYLENLIDCIFAVSREVSRRESDWDDDKRENSIEKKRGRR
jgi:hypothetical protein